MATPAPLSDLNRRFEISGIAKIVDGRGRTSLRAGHRPAGHR